MTLNILIIAAWFAGIGIVTLISYPLDFTPRFAKKQNRGARHA